MVITIEQRHIRAAKRGYGDPVDLAVDEQTDRKWIIGYSTITYGRGEKVVEYETPAALRIWMAIWDAGGNEGPFQFELPEMG